MAATFDWDNFEDIAIALTDKFPDVDPYTVARNGPTARSHRVRAACALLQISSAKIFGGRVVQAGVVGSQSL